MRGIAGRYKLIAAVVIAALSPALAVDWVSQCLTNGTTVELDCPIDDDYIYWYSEDEYDVDYDEYGDRGLATFTASLSNENQDSYGVEEVSCHTDGDTPKYSHIVVLVTDATNPVLPIIPTLLKGDRDFLMLSWDNIATDFDNGDFAYYNYTIRVNVTNGYFTTLNLSVSVLEQHMNIPVNLTGQECQPVEIAISMPGNCEPNILHGSLPIVPEIFQEDVIAEPLFNEERLWTLVSVTFTPPILCPFQQASYIHCFDDGEGESWCMDAVSVVDCSEPVTLTLSSSNEQRLKREKNYTLRVTVVTDHGNVSTTTDFSTESQRKSPGALSDLRDVYFNKSLVYLTWNNPDYPSTAFLYTITTKHYKTGEIKHYPNEVFPRIKVPSVSIDLIGNECENVEVSVAVYGIEEEKQSVNVSLPAYNTSFSSPLYVETSLYSDGRVREVELTFIPPRVCSFQTAVYVLTITETDGTEIYYIGPVMVKDSLQPVKIELETGFLVNTQYTATVTVSTEFGNTTSSQNFSFELPEVKDHPVKVPVASLTVTDPAKSGLSEKTGGTSSVVVGGAVGGVLCLLFLVLVCGFIGGIAVVYHLRQRKGKKQREMMKSAAKCMVHNPIYGGSGEIYEELPDDPPAQQLFINFNGASATPLPPSVPPPRKTDQYHELSADERAAIEAKLSCSAPGGGGDTLSLNSSRCGDDTEDCYTVMSPAGTLTVLPRNNRHSAGSLGANWSAPHGALN